MKPVIQVTNVLVLCALQQWGWPDHGDGRSHPCQDGCRWGGPGEGQDHLGLLNSCSTCVTSNVNSPYRIMDANVCDKDHNPTNCYLTVTTRIAFDRAAEENAGPRSDVCPAAAKLPDFAQPVVTHITTAERF